MVSRLQLETVNRINQSINKGFSNLNAGMCGLVTLCLRAGCPIELSSVIEMFCFRIAKYDSCQPHVGVQLLTCVWCDRRNWFELNLMLTNNIKSYICILIVMLDRRDFECCLSSDKQTHRRDPHRKRKKKVSAKEFKIDIVRIREKWCLSVFLVANNTFHTNEIIQEENIIEGYRCHSTPADSWALVSHLFP